MIIEQAHGLISMCSSICNGRMIPKVWRGAAATIGPSAADNLYDSGSIRPIDLAARAMLPADAALRFPTS